MMKPVAMPTVDPSKETTRCINIIVKRFEELKTRTPMD
jgi:hypothetical protein